MDTPDYDPFDVFDIKAEQRRDEAPEHLADYCLTYEITINIPQDTLSLLEHIEIYKNVWAHLKDFYKTKQDLYFIEYCKSGQAHLHGYIIIPYHPNAFKYDDEYFLKDVAKTIYKILPKKYFKQYNKAIIIPFYRQFKTPALLLNLKNYLSTNWINYIQKNALKN